MKSSRDLSYPSKDELRGSQEEASQRRKRFEGGQGSKDVDIRKRDVQNHASGDEFTVGVRKSVVSRDFTFRGKALWVAEASFRITAGEVETILAALTASKFREEKARSRSE